jgi:hypothetical protein
MALAQRVRAFYFGDANYCRQPDIHNPQENRYFLLLLQLPLLPS